VEVRGVKQKTNAKGERGFVQVYQLILKKPNKLEKGDKVRETIDEKLIEIGQEKEKILKEWMKKLKNVSIENDDNKRGNRKLCKKDKEVSRKAVIREEMDEFGDSDFENSESESEY